MPIIRNKKRKENCTIKATVNPEVLSQIEMYCQWAGIYDFGYFIEKASNELFLEDEEWLLYKKQMQETTTTTTS